MNAAEWARELPATARALPDMLQRLTPGDVARLCRGLPERDRLYLVAAERRAALEVLAAGSETPAGAAARAARLEVLARAFEDDPAETAFLLRLAVDVRAGPGFLEERRRAYESER